MFVFGEDHKVQFNSVTKEDAPAYLAFLQHQVDRHRHEHGNALAMLVEHEAMVKLWDSAATRHFEKALAATSLKDKLKIKFSLGED